MIKKAKILPTKILVTEIKEEIKERDSGIVLVDLKKPSTIKGIVDMVGQGTEKLPMITEVGMTVLFPPLAAQRFELSNEEYLLVDQSSVLFMYKQ